MYLEPIDFPAKAVYVDLPELLDTAYPLGDQDALLARLDALELVVSRMLGLLPATAQAEVLKGLLQAAKYQTVVR